MKRTNIVYIPPVLRLDFGQKTREYLDGMDIGAY